MLAYRLCDFALESNIPFVELPSAGAERRELAFHLDLNGRVSHGEPDWITRTSAQSGRTWLAIARIGADYLLRFPGLAEFVISSDGREIRARRLRPMPLGTVRHLLLDQVLPLALSRRSDLVLHAGAVSTPHGVIALMGPSGTGKSTLAASLARSGFPLVADDFLWLRKNSAGLVAVPSYPGFRLWADAADAMFGSEQAPRVAHYTSKKRCGAGSAIPFAVEAAPLVRAFVLSEGMPGAAPRVTPLPAREAFQELARHSYRLDADDHESLLRQFDLHGHAVRSVAFRRLEYPRRFAVLADVHRAILADLAETPSWS
jgi:hypothetical protein